MGWWWSERYQEVGTLKETCHKEQHSSRTISLKQKTLTIKFGQIFQNELRIKKGQHSEFNKHSHLFAVNENLTDILKCGSLIPQDTKQTGASLLLEAIAVAGIWDLQTEKK